MNTYSVDYESRWNDQLSIKTLGVEKYVRSTDVYLVAIVGPDVRFVGHPSEAPWHRIAGHRWIAANAAFDRTVHNVLVETGVQPDCRPAEWDCVLNLASHNQLPSNLARAVKVALGESMDKSVRDKDMKDLDFHSADPALQEKIKSYALRDAELALEFWEQESRHWLDWERALSEHTMRIAMAGVHVNVPAVQEAIELLSEAKQVVERSIPWAGELDEKDRPVPVASAKMLARECQRKSIPVPASTSDIDTRYLLWMEEWADRAPFVAALKQWRSINRTLRVVETIDQRRIGNRVTFSARYCGSPHTRRWSGGSSDRDDSDPLNMWNLPKEEIDLSDLLGRSVTPIYVRGMFVPKPGNRFAIYDFSQIEPRVLAVLSGNEKLLDLMRTGIDVYEAQLRAQGRYHDHRPLKEVDPKLRHAAKGENLGLGYRMGPARYMETLKIQLGTVIEPREAEANVARWRAANPEIQRFWARLASWFKAGCIRRDGENTIQLMSGRPIRYFEPGYLEGEMVASIVKGDKPKKFYDGKITENVTQGTARDVMGQGVLALERAGFDVRWTVHDEVITEVPADGADEAAREIEHILVQAPDWAPNLPLAVEGKVLDHYEK